ncbi:MAG: hypothetical protein AB7S93_11125 [Xanthobacteraceae bacterium]
MAPRQIKMPETTDSGPEAPVAPLSQSKRPELGRFLLQVDRQTKGSYASADAASIAGLAIKKKHPVVSVSIYDSIETVNTAIELPSSS